MACKAFAGVTDVTDEELRQYANYGYAVYRSELRKPRQGVLFAGCEADESRTWADDCDPDPTDALPGSEEKVSVMRSRYRRRQSCFHDHDPQQQPNYAQAFLALGRKIKLAQMRDANHRLPNITEPEGTRTYYRLQVWDAIQQKHEHIGRYETEEEAHMALHEWAEDQGIDTRTNPPAWLIDVMRMAGELGSRVD